MKSFARVVYKHQPELLKKTNELHLSFFEDLREYFGFETVQHAETYFHYANNSYMRNTYENKLREYKKELTLSIKEVAKYNLYYGYQFQLEQISKRDLTTLKNLVEFCISLREDMEKFKDEIELVTLKRKKPSGFVMSTDVKTELINTAKDLVSLVPKA